MFDLIKNQRLNYKNSLMKVYNKRVESSKKYHNYKMIGVCLIIKRQSVKMFILISLFKSLYYFINIIKTAKQ
jgi:hypothetical protein